jgi:hypothetical protein
MEKIKIRKISTKDIDQLTEISKQTFAETFTSHNSEENMSKYLAFEFANEKLLAELTNKNSEFFFAEIENKTIGYLKINYGPVQTEIKDERAIEIERIYVLKEYHGKNIGPILFEKAFEIAKAKEVEYIWLGVWERNYRAIRFYEKNGFTAFDKHLFKLGNDVQTDLMMKLKVKN